MAMSYDELPSNPTANWAWMADFCGSMGMERPLFMEEKKLTNADTNSHHCLLISRKVVEDRLLPSLSDVEHAAINNEGMEVKVFDEFGGLYAMTFTYWNSNGQYAFIGEGWKDFIELNELEVNDELPIFALRSKEGRELCFAMAIARPG